MANTSIWVRLIRHNRIWKDITEPCTHESWKEALQEACRRLDVPRPMVIEKHERDWANFSQTRFLADHFIESVEFERMEAEFIDPEEKRSVNEKYL